MLFKERNFEQAEIIYKNILKADESNIDALNSLAYCIKFKAASSNGPLAPDLFEQIKALYEKALTIDSDDIEANFNLGSLYLQYNRES